MVKVRELGLKLLFFVVAILQFLWECRIAVGFVLLIALVWSASEASDKRMMNEYNEFKQSCESRGGFALKTSDGPHCLDKNLQK